LIKSSEAQNNTLFELHKLFNLIWQTKKKCCDNKSWKYFFYYSAHTYVWFTIFV